MADLSTELVEIIDKMKANGWGSNDIMSFVKTVLTNLILHIKLCKMRY
jgi:hypothetical protein